jgi:hypothetical protein
VGAENSNWRLRRSVPYSQVWPGSRGRERGRIHLELAADRECRIGRLTRHPGELLCGKRPWHSEPARLDDDEPCCSRCVELAERYAIAWPTIEQTLNADERRALGHLRGRTRTGKFACRMYDWTEQRWRDALDGLTNRGYRVRRVSGQVADDPTVTGGWILKNEDRGAGQGAQR